MRGPTQPRPSQRRRAIRRALTWLAAFVGAAVLLLAGGLYVLYTRADTSNVGELGFRNKLKIPPLLEPREDSSGRKVFDLDLRAGTGELIPGKPVETWGYNGPYLGPTLRASRGDRVLMRVHNGLPEATTTTHWHGMHLPGAADGGPHQPIKPGAVWTPSWEIDQSAATLWYHPHLHRETEDHVYRGLAGMFILDDLAADRLALPDDYGVDDIPVIIQDRRLEDDGSLEFSAGLISPISRLGDEILINGTHDPHLVIDRQRTRLRLLNASAARIYEIGFSDGRKFDLIATDQGLLERPERLDRVPLSPGERAEIVVELRAGESVVLRSFKPNLGSDFFNERFSGGDDSFDLLELRGQDQLGPSPELPVPLAQPSPFGQPDSGAVRRFELSSSSTINGEEMDPARIDEVVPLHATEIWEVENQTGVPHTFHPHGTSFRILEYEGEPAPPHLTGPKDNVLVRPNESVRLLIRFGDSADVAAPFMFHCHLLHGLGSPDAGTGLAV